MSTYADTLRERSSLLPNPEPERVSDFGLADWAFRRFSDLAGSDDRTRLYAEMLLLQERYMHMLPQAGKAERRALQASHEEAFRRLSERLWDVAPPLLEPVGTRPQQPPPPEAGVELFEDET